MFNEILNNINWTEVIVALISILVPVSLFVIKIQNRQTQKSGKNSNNLQAHGDINITGQIHDQR